MSERIRQTTAMCVAMLALATGCHPTQPFYFENDGDLSHYLDTATQIEYPDVEREPLSEATGAIEPLHLRNLEFAEFWDITLEEAIAMALHNSEIVRSSAMFQQFGFASTGASRVANAATIYDIAISETETTPTPLQVDGSGNRVLSRGATRASTVGGYADALAEFDAQLFSNFNYSTTDRPRNVGPGNVFNPVIGQGHDSNFLMSLSKRTATGGVWTARQTVVYSENNTAIGVGRAVPSDYTAAFEMEMTHPLLRGAGPQVNRVGVILARIRSDITMSRFEIGIRDLVLDVERTYWDLHCAYRIVDANRQGRDAALRAWRNDQPRAGKKDRAAQEPRSNGQYLRFRSRYEASLAANTQGQGLLVLERHLRGLMGIAATDSRVLRPIDEPSAAYLEFSWDDVQLESLVRSPELRQQKWSIKQAEQELISARNQLLPDLNLGLRHRVVGVGDDLINADRRGANFEDTPIGSLAFDNLTEGNFTESNITLTFQPNAIGARRANARLLNAKLRLKRSEKVLEEMENNVVHELSHVYADLNNQYQLAQIAYSQWMAAQDEVQKLEVLMKTDDRVHDQMLDAFDRRSTARIEYFQRLCDYNKAIANVHYVKGTLLDYNGVSLAEGPWPKKAYWDALGRARERDASYYLNYGATRPAVVSQGAVPQGAVPQGAVPQGAVPQGAVPQGAEGAVEEGRLETVPQQPGEMLYEDLPDTMPDADDQSGIPRNQSDSQAIQPAAYLAPDTTPASAPGTTQPTAKQGSGFAWGNLGIAP